MVAELFGISNTTVTSVWVWRNVLVTGGIARMSFQGTISSSSPVTAASKAATAAAFERSDDPLGLLVRRISKRHSPPPFGRESHLLDRLFQW